MPRTAADYRGEVKPVWCPGCGDFAVLASLQRSLAAQEIDPSKLVICSGIGCSGRTPAFVKCYGFHGVHGRVLPTAMGVKLANPQLTVLAVGGDGDGLAIGAGHFPHACRRNIDITYIMLDNNIYGLTKGQFSPTSLPAEATASTPYGNIEAELDPVLLAITYNATFVARVFSGNPSHMAQIITQAVRHQGFSFVHAISPCLTFAYPYDHYAPKVQMISADHDPSDRRAAMQLAADRQWIHLGVFYLDVSAVDFTARLQAVADKATQRAKADIREVLSKYE
ncbi:MAG: 2-oxoacid:ferredoxin oxidoreductase subunit beta [Armatimonadota bacterium]